jgi:uncharacterized repeat protein (TIGR01451 family)
VIVAWIDDRNGICGPGSFSNCNVIVQHLSAAGQPQWAAGGVAVSPVDAAHSQSGISNEGTSGIGMAADGLGGVGPVGSAPSVIGDGAGGALIGWLNVQVDPLTQVPPIVFQHVTADGQMAFSSGAIPALPIANSQYSVIDNGAGSAIVAAQVQSQSGAIPDVWAQRIDVSGALPWGANGVPVAVAPDFQNQVQAAADGFGGALIVWSDYRNAIDQFSPDIYAQRIDASGTPVWPANGVPVTSGVSAVNLALIVGDGNGGAIVVWQDSRNLITPLEQYTGDFGRDLYAQHLSATGVPLWPANGVPVTTGPFNQGVDYGSQNVPSFAMVTDAAGGAILAWPDGRSTPCPISVGARECDVYAQRISDQAGPAAVADLSVTMTEPPSPPTPLAPVTFQIVVTNKGPDSAQSVNVTNFPAAGTLFTSLTSSQGACVLDSLCSLGRLDSGATATVTYVVTAGQGGTAQGSVAVYAAETDPDLSNNKASSSQTIETDFTLATSPPSQTVTSGSTATYSITATAIGGGSFGSPLAFACGNLPAHTTCAFSNQSSTGGTSSVTLTIATGVVGTQAALALPLAGLSTFPLPGLICARRRWRRTPARITALTLAVGLTLASCGGGGSGSSSGPVTPAGTYTINVTATNSGFNHTGAVTLVVQ